MTKPELETRVIELIRECNSTANDLTDAQADLESARDLLRVTRLELVQEIKKGNALARTLRLYLDLDLGEQ